MATYIQTDELSGTVLPSNAGSLIRKDQYGIDTEITGLIIQNVVITNSRVTDDTYDQKNALVSQLDVDQRWDGQMTVIGPSDESGSFSEATVGDLTFSYDNKSWKVTGVTFTGAYNDKKTYNVTFFRTVNFPS